MISRFLGWLLSYSIPFTKLSYEPVHEISNNVVCATSKASDQPAHTRSLIRAFANRLNILMSVNLLAEHHLEFLSLKEAAQAGVYTCQNATLLEITCHGSYVLAQQNKG